MCTSSGANPSLQSKVRPRVVCVLVEVLDTERWTYASNAAFRLQNRVERSTYYHHGRNLTSLEGSRSLIPATRYLPSRHTCSHAAGRRRSGGARRLPFLAAAQPQLA